MITLKYNFKTSLMPIDHEQSFYSKYILTQLVAGWDGKVLDAQTASVEGQPPQDQGVTYAHDLADTLGVSEEAIVLQHVPGPTHYDLWDPFDPNTIDGLFLRVIHSVVPPPPWLRYIHSPYSGPGGGAQFDQDFSDYQTAVLQWISDAGEAAFHLVKSADIGFGEGLIGFVDASSPVFSPLLAKWSFIQSHPTTVYGSSHNDTIEGGNVHGRLFGGPGDDLLIAGKEGNDYLNGGPGADTLVAGHGHDTMFGGTGADLFRFNLLGESPPTRPDVIWDFHHGQGDKIDIDGFAIPDAVLFIGRESFAHRYHHNHLAIEMVRAVPIAPGTNLVQATDDGGAQVQLAIVVHGSVPRSGDFIFHA